MRPALAGTLQVGMSSKQATAAAPSPPGQADALRTSLPACAGSRPPCHPRSPPVDSHPTQPPTPAPQPHPQSPTPTHLEVHVWGARDLFKVHLQDLAAALHVRVGHHHVAIKPPRTHQRLVQRLGEVGGRNDDHACASGGAESGARGREKITPRGWLPDRSSRCAGSQGSHRRTRRSGRLPSAPAPTAPRRHR